MVERKASSPQFHSFFFSIFSLFLCGGATFLFTMPSRFFSFLSLYAENLVLDYLRRQNRPYSQSRETSSSFSSCSFSASFFFFSADDIFNNLHGKVGKANLTKVLTALSNSGEISLKNYAKSQIYVAKQVRGFFLSFFPFLLNHLIRTNRRLQSSPPLLKWRKWTQSMLT